MQVIGLSVTGKYIIIAVVGLFSRFLTESIFPKVWKVLIKLTDFISNFVMVAGVAKKILIPPPFSSWRRELDPAVFLDLFLK